MPTRTPLYADTVPAPDGSGYYVRCYRSGTMARFPSATNPGMAGRGGALLLPFELVGWLLHLSVFRMSWTVAVTPEHNLPGNRYRRRVKTKDAAEALAADLTKRIEAGTWAPGQPHP